MRIVYDQYLLCSLVLSPTLKIHAGEIRLWWRVLNSKDREPYCCWWQKSSVGTWSLFPPLASQILTPLNLAVVYLSRRASQDLAQLFWLSCPPCVFSMRFWNLFLKLHTPWFKFKDYLSTFSQYLSLKFTVSWILWFFFFKSRSGHPLKSKVNPAYSKEIESDAPDQFWPVGLSPVPMLE